MRQGVHSWGQASVRALDFVVAFTVSKRETGACPVTKLGSLTVQMKRYFLALEFLVLAGRACCFLLLVERFGLPLEHMQQSLATL